MIIVLVLLGALNAISAAYNLHLYLEQLRLVFLIMVAFNAYVAIYLAIAANR